MEPSAGYLFRQYVPLTTTWTCCYKNRSIPCECILKVVMPLQLAVWRAT